MTAKEKSSELISRYNTICDAEVYAGERLGNYLVSPGDYNLGYYHFWTEVLEHLDLQVLTQLTYKRKNNGQFTI